MQERRAGRGTAGQAQRAVELAETLGCTISWVGYCAIQLYSCTGSPIDGRLRLGPVCARCVACGARLHGACPAYHVMHACDDRGMRQWGLRRLPPRDARERSHEPRGGGGRGVVSRACLHSESRPGRANGTYWLSLIGWSVPETVYVSGRRTARRPSRRPRGHISRVISRGAVSRAPDVR